MKDVDYLVQAVLSGDYDYSSISHGFGTLEGSQAALEKCRHRYEYAAQEGRVEFDCDLGVLDTHDIKRFELYQRLSSVMVLIAGTLHIGYANLVAVGEPGCYVMKGHVDHDLFLDGVLDTFDEDGENLEEPRHTWMVVTASDAGADHRYLEVFPSVEGPRRTPWSPSIGTGWGHDDPPTLCRRHQGPGRAVAAGVTAAADALRRRELYGPLGAVNDRGGVQRPQPHVQDPDPGWRYCPAGAGSLTARPSASGLRCTSRKRTIRIRCPRYCRVRQETTNEQGIQPRDSGR